MVMPAEKRGERTYGNPVPRVAPPTPARSGVASFRRTAKSIGINLIPWQDTCGRYINALGPKDLWLYPEFAAVVSRQNGKTELILPHIVDRLEKGRRIGHAAQTRELPRFTFNRLAPIVEHRWTDARVRRGAGQETIEIPSTGGFYKIMAATSGAPRGLSLDDLIGDELRELDEDFINSALPTLTASKNPQVLYLSNAGTDDSAALNAVRARAGVDPALAYLEWSARPDRTTDDREGWVEANPSIGHFPGLMAFLERSYESHRLAGTLASFETEHLCRWVATLRERLVEDGAWQDCAGPLARPLRPVLAVAMDPRGERASIALAWKAGDLVSLRLLYDVTGHPIDTDLLGTELRATANKLGVKVVGYDPYTDAELVKYVPKAEPINGGRYANASAQFVNLVAAGKLRWQDCDAVTSDLAFTAKKPTGENSFHAVRSDDDRPITASLAAIRAVWLASGPQPAVPRVM